MSVCHITYKFTIGVSYTLVLYYIILLSCDARRSISVENDIHASVNIADYKVFP